VQAALSQGLRRLEVSAPDGLCFYGEGSKQTLGDPDYAVQPGIKDKADRDLACIVCEMFAPLGDEVACLLPSDDALTLAQREWAKSRLSTRLLSSVSALGGGGGGGFAKAGAATAPLRVLVVVRANKERLEQLAPILTPLGNEVVVVLVNPVRMKKGGSRKGYTPAFVLRDNPHPEWRGGLLYHKFQGQWLLAVSGSRGAAVVHGRSPQRPSLDDIDAGFAQVKDDASLVSKAGGLFSAAGTAAALERRTPITPT